MYLSKTPRFIQNMFPFFVWNMPMDEKEIFLTFDDGPHPQITPWVLDVLKTYNAKATFFCIGKNVEENKEILDRIVAEGHSLGNHTYSHKSGWHSDNIAYFHNIRRCARLVKSSLFRPPYGRIKPNQASFLRRHYQIIMWDVLSGDFDPNVSSEKCLDNVVQNVENGSIVVFHDSEKAYTSLEYALPRCLETLSKQGYTFNKITEAALNKTAGKKTA